MARVLGISRSGFYDWRAQPAGNSASERRRAAIDGPVHSEFFRKKQRYGGPRLTRELAQQGFVFNEKTVQASLARQQLCARAGRKFKVTTNSNHNLPVAPNRLEQDFSAHAPNEKWVGDITYLWTSEGWLYLAMFLDLYSRAVVGWSMASHMRAELVCDALRMALWRRHMPGGVIVHTDQGVQYCSNNFQQLLRDHKLVSSMSARGNCFEMQPRRASSTASRWKRFTTSVLVREPACVRPCLNTLKLITIEPANTAPTAISARRRLRRKPSPKAVSVFAGEDQTPPSYFPPCISVSRLK
jgi:putative transposase